MKKNIAILMGGYSNEYKISLKSGKVVFETLKIAIIIVFKYIS